MREDAFAAEGVGNVLPGVTCMSAGWARFLSWVRSFFLLLKKQKQVYVQFGDTQDLPIFQCSSRITLAHMST